MMQPQKLTEFAWPVILVALSGTYAFWASQRHLQSSRPEQESLKVAPPVATPGLKAFPSRMWEDPLTGAYKDAGVKASKEEARKNEIKDGDLSQQELPKEAIRYKAKTPGTMNATFFCRSSSQAFTSEDALPTSASTGWRICGGS